MKCQYAYFILFITLLCMNLMTYAITLQNNSPYEVQSELTKNDDLSAIETQSSDDMPLHGVELESEVLDLPHPPTFLDLGSQTEVEKDNRKGSTFGRVVLAPTEEQRMRLSMRHLTQEVMALTHSVNQARALQRRAMYAAMVPKNMGHIAPSAVGNGKFARTPININGQLHVNGRPVPGATVNSLKDINRGPVGRLHLKLPKLPPKVGKSANAPRPSAPQQKSTSTPTPPPARAAVKDLSKIKRGPVGRLKLPSLDALKNGLKKYQPSSAPAPAGAPSSAKAGTNAQSVAAPLPPKTQVLTKNMKRGPVGRLKLSSLIAQPPNAVATPGATPTAAPNTPSVNAGATPAAKLPPPTKTLTKGMKRGPVGRLKLSAVNTPSAPAAGAATGAPVPGAAPGQATPAAPANNATTSVPLPTKTLTKGMKRGPVGRLDLNKIKKNKSKKQKGKRVKAPGASGAGSTATTSAPAKPTTKRPRSKTLTKDLNRGPVGRLQALPLQQQLALPALPQAAVGGSANPQTNAQAQALAQVMFRKWVQDFQAKTGVVNTPVALPSASLVESEASVSEESPALQSEVETD